MAEADNKSDEEWRQWHMQFEAAKTNTKAIKLWCNSLQGRMELVLKSLEAAEKWDPEVRRVEVFTSEFVTALKKFDKVFGIGLVLIGGHGPNKATKARAKLLSRPGSGPSATSYRLLKRKVHRDSHGDGPLGTDAPGAGEPEGDSSLPDPGSSVPQGFGEGPEESGPEGEGLEEVGS